MRNLFSLPLGIRTTTLRFGISDFGYMQSPIYSEKQAMYIPQIDLPFIYMGQITTKCQTSNTCDLLYIRKEDFQVITLSLQIFNFHALFLLRCVLLMSD